MDYSRYFGIFTILIITEDMEKWKQKILEYLELSNFTNEKIRCFRDQFVYYNNFLRIIIITKEKDACHLGRQHRIIIDKKIEKECFENIIQPLASLSERIIFVEEDKK